MNKTTITILAVVAIIVVLAAVGYGIHHMMNPESMNPSSMPM